MTTYTSHNGTLASVHPPMGTWSFVERARALRAEYLPVLPAMVLDDREYIADLVDRIDLRALYPHLRGKVLKVPCLWHRDVGHPSMGVFPTNVHCFTCKRSAPALKAIQELCGCRTTSEVFAIARGLLSDTPRTPDPTPAALAPLDAKLLAQYALGLRVKYRGRRVWWETKYGMDEAAQEAMGLGHAGMAFSFPVFNLAGELLNIRFRRDPELWNNPEAPRYWGLEKRNGPLWYFAPGVRGRTVLEAYASRYHKRTLCWVESETDAAALACSLGVPALSTTAGAGGWKSPAFPLSDLVGCRVFVMFDADPAGDTHSVELVRALQGLGISAQHIQLPGRGVDAADLVAQGWTRESFQALLRGDDHAALAA